MEDETIDLILEEPGERLDRALVNVLPDLSRAQVQKLIKEERVLVNGRFEKANFRLEGSESVTVDLPPIEDVALIAEDKSLNNLVLVDDEKRIRGQYNSLDVKETDRLILELKILKKEE